MHKTFGIKLSCLVIRSAQVSCAVDSVVDRLEYGRVAVTTGHCLGGILGPRGGAGGATRVGGISESDGGEAHWQPNTTAQLGHRWSATPLPWAAAA
jgi:hypothetical protein